MHDLPILVNIAIALSAAFIGGLAARRLKLPPMVGYLLAGFVISPFTPGYHGDVSTIQQLAELGIVFLMFGVGLEFSVHDLWSVRKIAIPGALIQTFVITLLVMLVMSLWGWSLVNGLLIGLAVVIASTVVMIRNMTDNGLINTSHGKVAIGWLILEDLMTVLILVLLPALTSHSSAPIWQTVGIALLKTVVFAVLMLVVGKRLIPLLLTHIAYTRSRELFMVAVVIVSLGTALTAAAFFGVSLALGAFLTGVVINEATLTHQVEKGLLPFRDIFTVLFFVSVGMLVNPVHLWQHVGEIFTLTLLIIVGKFLVVFLSGIVLAWSARRTLILAVGLSEIGEFSFILGQTGTALALISNQHYSILLAGAILSIIVNPFMFRLLPWFEKTLQKFPRIWTTMERNSPTLPVPTGTEAYKKHVLVVGCGRVGEHIIHVLKLLDIPQLVIELDDQRIQMLKEQNVPTLYGDVASSDVLNYAGVKDARAIVITIPDEIAAQIAIVSIRQLSKTVPVVVRATSQEGLHRLLALGATEVIQPELEGGLEVIQQTLMLMGYPNLEIRAYTDSVRSEHYNMLSLTKKEQNALERIKMQAHKLSEN